MPRVAIRTRAKALKERKEAIKTILQERRAMSPEEMREALGLPPSELKGIRQIMSHMKLDRLEDGRYAARPELCGARLIELTDVSRWADDCLRAPPPSLNGERNWV